MEMSELGSRVGVGEDVEVSFMVYACVFLSRTKPGSFVHFFDGILTAHLLKQKLNSK